MYGDRGIFATRIQSPAWRSDSISITSDTGLVNFNGSGGTNLTINTETGEITASGDISASGDITANTLRLTSTTDASATSTGHAFQSGLTTGANIIINGNEVMARNNGSVSTLHINPDGGSVRFHENAGNATIINSNGTITASGDISASNIHAHGGSINFGPINSDGILIKNDTQQQLTIAQGNDINTPYLIVNHNGVTIPTIIGGTSFNDQNITNVGSIDVDSVRADSDINVNISLGTGGMLFNAQGGDTFEFNLGEIDANFIYYDAEETTLIHGDAGLSRVGIGDSSPVSKLDVGGDLNVQTDITASGQISASSIVTGRYFIADATNSNGFMIGNDFALSGNSTLGLHLGPDSNFGSIKIGREVDNTQNISLHGPVTASGNISASGTVNALEIETGGQRIGTFDGTKLRLAEPTIPATLSTTNLTLNTPVTASYDISASGVIISDKYEFGHGGSQAYLQATDNTSLQAKFANSKFEGNITASGNISASGTVTTKYREYVNDVTVDVSSGDIITLGTGPNGVNGDIVAGRLYCMDDEQQWELVDANASVTSIGMLGIAIENATPTFLLKGVMYHANFAHGGAAGNPLYISETAGLTTGSAPTTAGAYVRIIGYQIDQTNRGIFFDPDKTWVELT